MEPLSDPKNDRYLKSAPLPPHKPLTPQLLFLPYNKINFNILKTHLKNQGKIAKPQLLKIMRLVAYILRNQPNLISIHDPITIAGDVHGQYYDLLKLLQVGGNPQNTKYLFLGDYVDRGSFSIQVTLLIFAMKINNPSSIVILRGNHECRQLTSFFNFRSQVLYKYDQQVYEVYMAIFDMLPLACLINNKFLCMHGGISPELESLQDLKKIDRFKQIPKNGMFCDLLWSDPLDSNDGYSEQHFKSNQVRGCSYYFGYQAAKTFLQKNKLISIIRGHEVQMQGYKMYRWHGQKHFPTVITLFSAPNYCDVYNNKGAVIKFVNNQLNIQQYSFQQHPYLLPNFLNVFSWSMPFVSQKVTQMLHFIVKHNKDTKQISQLPSFETTGALQLLETLLQMQHQKASKNKSLIQIDGIGLDSRLLQIGFGKQVKQTLKKQQKQRYRRSRNVDIQNQKRQGNYQDKQLNKSHKLIATFFEKEIAPKELDP